MQIPHRKAPPSWTQSLARCEAPLANHQSTCGQMEINKTDIHFSCNMHTRLACTAFPFALSIILMFCLLFNISPSLESPVVTVALSDILIGVGETTVMACSASGTPQPEIWWYTGNTLEAEGSTTKKFAQSGRKQTNKNHEKSMKAQCGAKIRRSKLTTRHCCTCSNLLGDVQLHSSSLLDMDTLGGTLTIKETQDVDAGDYTCKAVNAAGTSSGKISLDVGGESGTHHVH